MAQKQGIGCSPVICCRDVLALYRPAKRRHIVPAMTIVHYDYRPKRPRKAKAAVEFPRGRIVSARKPKPRHYGELPRNGRREKKS